VLLAITPFSYHKVGSVRTTHLRAYWLKISSMWIIAFFNKFLGKEERETYSSQFDS